MAAWLWAATSPDRVIVFGSRLERDVRWLGVPVDVVVMSEAYVEE